jgi:hypothetical protein
MSFERKSKALIALAASEETKARIGRSAKIMMDLGIHGSADLVVVTPEHLDTVQSLNQVVDPTLRQDGHYNLAKARNISCRLASQMGYDMLIVGDADSVFLTIPPIDQLLNKRLSQTLINFVSESDEMVYREERKSSSSWYVMRWDLFHKANLWNESYSGWGWEDIEFFARQYYDWDYRSSDSGVRALHINHERSALTPKSTENRARCRAYVDEMIRKRGPFCAGTYKIAFGEDHP